MADAVGQFEFGRVVARTFGLVGRNFLAFTFLSLLLVGVPQFALVLFQSYVVQGVFLLGVSPIAITLGVTLVTLILAYVLMAMLTRASIDDLSKGRASLGAAIGDGVRYFFPLFIVALLTSIGVLLGMILLIVPGIYLAVRWLVATPALVAEDIGPTAALGRSADLTEGRRWIVFALALLYFIFAIVVEGVFTVAAGALGVSTEFVGSLDAVTVTISAVGSVVGSLTSMVSAVGTAALYFELRHAKEGVSVADLAAVFE